MDVPPVFGEWRRQEVLDNVVVPRLFLAFRSPTFGSQGSYAAQLCAAILGGQRGSRLHRSLVREQQVASAASAFTFDLAKGSDLLVIDATARPNVTAIALETAVAHAVDELANSGPTEEELNRARAITETDFLKAMQTAGDRADRLSQFATYFGDPHCANEQLGKYESVRLKDVSDFASSRLKEDNRATLLFLPRNGTE
jgi:predicted Zn-dependent peptidase